MWDTLNWLFVALNPPLISYCSEILRPLGKQIQNRRYRPSYTGAMLMHVISQHLLLPSKHGSTFCGDWQWSNPRSTVSALYVCIGLRQHIFLLSFLISFSLFILVGFSLLSISPLKCLSRILLTHKILVFPSLYVIYFCIKVNYYTVTDYKH